MQLLLWTIAILIAGAAALWVYRADKKRNISYPWLTATLRGVAIFLTLLLLLAPVISITRNEVEKPIILFLQDNSRSIGVALGKDSDSYKNNAEQLLNNLSAKYQVVKWGFGNNVHTGDVFHYTQQATDISTVLSRALDFYSNQNLGAVVMATDGRFNQGSNPLFDQLSLRSPLYCVAIGDTSVIKDLQVAKVYANKSVALNSQFEIRADILSTLCKGYSGNIVLQEKGNTITSNPLSIPSDKYDKSVSFLIKASEPGLHHYSINIPVAEGEKNTANNHRDIFVEVEDKKKNILILCAAPHPDVNAISDALSGLPGYKVTVKTADNIPQSFNDYQVVILHQLPSLNMHLLQQAQLTHKPVWFILGSQSNIMEINKFQKYINITPAPTHDVQVRFNPTFNAFIVPQTVQSVMDRMPPLSVPADDIRSNPSASTLFSNRNSSVEEPVWTLQSGQEPVAILAGTGIWRWRLYEYKNFGNHDVIDECIRQTISFLSANSNESPFRVELPKLVWSDQEAINLYAYLLNPSNEQINTPDASITITDSSGNKRNFSFERNGNSYRLNIGILAGGTYTYTAHTVYNNKTYTANGSFNVESIPLELMQTGADYPLLYALSKKYNGALFPASNIVHVYDSIINNEAIKPIIRSNTESVPLVDKKWYFFIILLVITAEWLLRKYWLAQ
jgi:hypothetical protein